VMHAQRGSPSTAACCRSASILQPARALLPPTCTMRSLCCSQVLPYSRRSRRARSRVCLAARASSTHLILWTIYRHHKLRVEGCRLRRCGAAPLYRQGSTSEPGKHTSEPGKHSANATPQAAMPTSRLACARPSIRHVAMVWQLRPPM
jgi:hypothetical protein